MKLFFMLMLALLSGAHGKSQTDFFQAEGAAIRGYDPVSYFKAGKPVKGTPAFSVQWSNATWLFANRENMEAFKANPSMYAPQFGGFCAYGVSENHKSPTDPQAWTIANNKLYLNYNPKVRELWLRDTTSRIPAAEKFWISLNQ